MKRYSIKKKPYLEYYVNTKLCVTTCLFFFPSQGIDIHFKTKWKNIQFNILLHFGGSVQVKADRVSFYLAFVCLRHISLCSFQTNTGTLDLLSCIYKYANERTEKVIVFIRKRKCT